MPTENKSEIIIFKTSDNTVSIDVRFEGETVWLTIDDMASLFERSRSTINEHILNIFEEGELDKESSVRKIGISDFSTKPTNYYNPKSSESIAFFKMVQNKFHYAVNRQTAAEIVMDYCIKARSFRRIFCSNMKSDYLTSKPAFYALFVFSLPIIIGNLFQQLYTMVDSAVVGRFVGEQALAAVGASYSLTVVFICVAIGGGVGSSVIVSKYFGARNFSAMKTAVSTAFLTFLGISVFLGVVGIVINRPLLVLLKTPSDALDMALVYLRIYFLGLPFLFMYNVISSMFNAIGNSRIPLVFLIFSSVLNVALDFLFVAVFKTGVAGAAWATLIAQGLSCVLSFAVFMRTLGKFKDSEDEDAAAGKDVGFSAKILVEVQGLAERILLAAQVFVAAV